MKNWSRIVLALGVLATAGGAALRNDREESLLVFENRKISILVPQLFSYDVGKTEAGLAAIRIADPKERLSVDLTILPDPEGMFMNARARKEKMVELFQQYVESSVEKAMQFEELEPRMGAGTYCVFTDAALVGKTTLPPGEFHHLTVGVKAWPGVLVIFRAFSNDTKSDDYQAVMKMFRQSVEEKSVPLR